MLFIEKPPFKGGWVGAALELFLSFGPHESLIRWDDKTCLQIIDRQVCHISLTILVMEK